MPWRISRFDAVESTNELALEALERGAGRDGDVFVARTQQRGRGTRGRSWVSGPGGLYLSAILESPSIPAPGLWTIAGAVAVHDLATASGIEAQLDWPNDLVTPGGAKLAGVLAESRGLRAGEPATFVLGVGVNVERRPAPDATAGRLTSSLSAEGSRVTVDGAETLLLDALAARVTEARARPETLYAGFFERCALARREVEVSWTTGTVSGTFESLDPSGGVHLRGPGGEGRIVSIAHIRSIRSPRGPGGSSTP